MISMTDSTFFTINSISISVNRSTTSVFFQAACHDNPDAEIKSAESKPYISRHIFRKLLNT